MNVFIGNWLNCVCIQYLFNIVFYYEYTHMNYVWKKKKYKINIMSEIDVKRLMNNVHHDKLNDWP